MRRDDLIDFFIIPDHQIAIHIRLENWSRYVEHKLSRGDSRQHPMWAKSRSNARQWHEPDLREATDELDGGAMEKAVAMLPHKHRDAIRWNYVWKGGPLHQARKLGVSKDGLRQLVQDARQMLMNRRV
jgi:DNA-directed RNA polymerase specialized sigma24 family protein